MIFDIHYWEEKNILLIALFETGNHYKSYVSTFDITNFVQTN